MNRSALLAVPAAVLALIIGLIVTIVVVIDDSSSSANTGCTLNGDAATITGTLPATVAGYSGDQLTNAAAIVTIGAQRGLDAHAQQTALVAAMVESSLTNASGGDRDSAGLFQMRPSQGWGTYAQITDTTYAITTFYQRLVAVDGWRTLTPGAAAQAVERSAFPDAYATKVPAAAAVMQALTGITANVSATNAGLTCTSASDSGDVGGDGDSGESFILPPGLPIISGAHPDVINAVLTFAEAQVGKPYVYGGSGPNGWDCSGLTLAAYAAAGITIGPHKASAQWANAVASGNLHPLADAVAGDLIFWGGTNAYHVGIALGGGWMVAAPQTGENVKIEKVWGTPNTQVWRVTDALGT